MTRCRRALVAVMALLLVSAAACSTKDNDSDDVREFIDATDHLAHRFVYTEETSERRVVVQGIVEDDFRYKTKVVRDGADVLETVVHDDGVAVRFFDAGQLAEWVDRLVVNEVDQATDLPGIGVFDALRARRWVFDAAGAPPALVTAEQREKVGEDPVFDARTALSYVRQLAEAKELTPLVKFNPEAITPTYRTDEDPFPVPEKGSGVDRYDLYQPNLPPAASAVSGTEVVFPSTLNFRKMAVYVKDGRVIRVMETIGLTPRLTDELEDYMRLLVESTGGEDLGRDFRASIGQLDGEERGTFLLQALNTIRDFAGDDPIRFRTMTLELRDLDADDLRVELPRETIKGSLAVLKNLGRKPFIEDEGPDTGTGAGTGTGSASGSSTTTTTVAGASPSG